LGYRVDVKTLRTCFPEDFNGVRCLQQPHAGRQMVLMYKKP
jgi:hypothetical protein